MKFKFKAKVWCYSWILKLKLAVNVLSLGLNFKFEADGWSWCLAFEIEVCRWRLNLRFSVHYSILEIPEPFEPLICGELCLLRSPQPLRGLPNPLWGIVSKSAKDGTHRMALYIYKWKLSWKFKVKDYQWSCSLKVKFKVQVWSLKFEVEVWS